MKPGRHTVVSGSHRRQWVLSVALAAFGAAGLDNGSRADEAIHYRVRIWQDGLPQTSVFAISQTPDGYLWVGTHEGLAHNSVGALYEDREHTLWIGTRGGGLDRLKERQIQRLHQQERSVQRRNPRDSRG